MDTGDMIEIRRLDIDPDETYGELQDRLAVLAAEMVKGWMPRIVAGDYPRLAQDDSAATYAPKVEKAEAELRFDRPAAGEYDRFRAFSPSPGPYIVLRGTLTKLSRMARAEGAGAPGTVIQTSPELVVAFAEGALVFLEIQPEGKKRVSGRDFANGARLRPGDRLLP
jgi:methionyl-tRNA formyltransferase